MPTNQNLQWIDKPLVYIKCPRCKVGNLDTRVPRGTLIKYALFFTDVKRYRCNNCYAKVYAKTNIQRPIGI